MQNKKKILVAYVTAGAGHMKAGTAIYEALKERGSELEVKAVDLLEYSTPLMKRLYPGLYLFLINKMPFLWGLLYYITDFRPLYLLLRHCLLWVDKMHCRDFERLILEYQPDVIVSTHFETSRIAAELIGKRRFQGRLITVITDYLPHAFWITDNLNTYVVGSRQAREALIKKWRVAEEKIELLGIPVGLLFSQSPDKGALLEKLGLEKGLYTVLILSGGFGVGPIEALVEELSRMQGLQLIVVCGKNPPLFRKIKEMKMDVPSKIYEFSNNMHELMSVADTIISKSGGISTAEALTKGLPMLVIAPLPGQETGNCRILLENQAAIRIKDAKEAKRRIGEFIAGPGPADALKKNIARLAKPHSAAEIAALAVNIAQGEKNEDSHSGI